MTFYNSMSLILEKSEQVHEFVGTNYERKASISGLYLLRLRVESPHTIGTIRIDL